MVDVAGAMEVEDAAVIVGIGPSCETTEGKVDTGNVELAGADAGVGVRVEGMDTGMSYINCLRHLGQMSGNDKCRHLKV
ncbi:hypothetical protein KI387_038543, partial [Taxus chinensis]